MSSQGEGAHLAPKGGFGLEPWREDLIPYLLVPHHPRILSDQSWRPWPIFEAPSPWGGYLGPLPLPPSLLILVSSSYHKFFAGGHEEWEEGGV